MLQVAGFLLRLSGEADSRYFKNEADALAWLGTAAAAHKQKLGG